MALQALLFDVDGTLADTERLGHRPAYNSAFQKLGLPFRWGPKLYRQLLKKTGGRERLRHYLDRYKPELGAEAGAAETDPETWVKSVHKLKSDYFHGRLKRGEVPLRPGVARLMREARAAGLRIAIVTSASRATLEPVLVHSLGGELVKALDFTICGEDVVHKKPAPDLYIMALSRMKLDPGACIAIEDSEMGLQSAVGAGVKTVITTNDNTVHDEFSAAELVLDTLGEPDHPARVMKGSMDEPCLTLATLHRLLGGRTS